MSRKTMYRYADMQATPAAPDGFKELRPEPMAPAHWGDWRPRDLAPVPGALGAMGVSTTHRAPYEGDEPSRRGRRPHGGTA